jgi:TonB family protein
MALHVLAVAILVPEPRQLASREVGRTPLAIEARLLSGPQEASASGLSPIEPEIIEAAIAPLKPAHELSFEAAPETFVASQPAGEFIPPRPEGLEGSAVMQALDSAAMSGARMARVILRVEVLPSGAAGVVHVEITSGRAGIDEAAIVRARALRWLPATYGGEPTTMWVRLPVVFTSAG